MNDRRVLVDTSVWIDYFRGEETAVARLDALIDADRIVICGIVKQEVLQGSRDPKSFRRLQQEMSIWEYAPERPEDFVEAARLFARLRWKGVTVPPSDCLVAVMALRCGFGLFAHDDHFKEIPRLLLV